MVCVCMILMGLSTVCCVLKALIEVLEYVNMYHTNKWITHIQPPLHSVPLTSHSGVGAGLIDLTYYSIAMQTFFPPIPNWHFKNLLLYYTMNYIDHLLTYLYTTSK